MALPSLSGWQICRARSLDVIQLRRQDILFTNHLDTFMYLLWYKSRNKLSSTSSFCIWCDTNTSLGKFNSNHQSLDTFMYVSCDTNRKINFTHHPHFVFGVIQIQRQVYSTSPIIWIHLFIWYDTNRATSYHHHHHHNN